MKISLILMVFENVPDGKLYDFHSLGVIHIFQKKFRFSLIKPLPWGKNMVPVIWESDLIPPTPRSISFLGKKLEKRSEFVEKPEKVLNSTSNCLAENCHKKQIFTKGQFSFKKMLFSALCTHCGLWERWNSKTDKY